MNLLQEIAGHLPQPLIKAVSRAQWRHPALMRAFNWCADRLRNRDGVILHGAGKGLRFNPAASNAGFVLGTSEPGVQRAMELLLKPGMTFYDVGANVGFHSVIGARLVGPSGCVVCFEPLPENLASIRHNAAINDFAHVRALQVALSDTDGEATFITSAKSTWGTLASVGVPPTDPLNKIEVTVRRLDGLAIEKHLPSPDVIKIDVEGAEAGVLAGAEMILLIHRPLLLIELHGTNGAVAGKLEELNYCVSVLGGTEPITEASWDSYIIGVPKERSDILLVARELGKAQVQRR